MVQNGGLEKASLYDHVEGFTTDSYLAKQDTLVRRLDRKKAVLTLF